MMLKPRVLILSYFFPPLNGPGVQRALNFAKNLKSLGWEPVILTVKPVEYISRDDALLDDLDGVKIYRSESLDPMRFLYLYKRIRKNKCRDIYHDTPNETKQFWRDIFPIDSKIFWLPFAYRMAMKICRQQKIDLILSTVSPYSSAILAYKLSRRTKIPHIIDYRDLWKGKPDITYFSRWHKKLADRWENRVISSAERIIHVTRLSADKFKEIYPECNQKKISVIFNGYDQEKLKKVFKKENSEKLTFSFAGHFYGGQTPQYILETIRSMEKENSIPENVIFNFAGKYKPEIEKMFEGINSVNRIPWQSYNKYLELLANSDILMLFVAKENSKMILTQKLFDYLAVKKPILAMIPSDGEAAGMINEYNAGFVCDIDNKEKIKQNVKELIILHKNKELNSRFPLHKNDYRIFERKYQAKQLADLMQEVING